MHRHITGHGAGRNQAEIEGDDHESQRHHDE